MNTFNTLDKLESNIRKILRQNNFDDNPRFTDEVKRRLRDIRELRGYDKRVGIRNLIRDNSMNSTRQHIQEQINIITNAANSVSDNSIIETPLRENMYLESFSYTINIRHMIEFTNMSLREYLGTIFIKKLHDRLNLNMDKRVHFNVYNSDNTFAMSSGTMRANAVTLEYIADKFSTEELYEAMDVSNITVVLSIRKLVGNGEIADIKSIFNIDKGVYEMKINEYCGQACLFIGNHLDEKMKIRRIMADSDKLLNEAKKYAKQINCDTPSMDLTDFENYKDKPLYIITYIDNNFSVCGEFNTPSETKPLYILLYKNHYYLVTAINKLLESKDCVLCKKCSDIHKKDFKCSPYKCKSCEKEYKSQAAFKRHTQKIEGLKCDTCKETLMFEGCRLSHKCAVNKEIKQCKNCNTIFSNINRYEAHIKNGCLFETYCDNCRNYYDIRKEHCCYLEPIDTSDKDLDVWVYDIECFINEEGYQEFAMAYIININTDEVIYIANAKVMLDFVANNESPKVLYAHNGAKYDNFIILEMLISNDMKINDNVIMKGRSPIQFTCNKVTFRDSILLFSAPLRDLPKMFGFNEMKKTIFPYKGFNEENKELLINDNIERSWFNEEDVDDIDEFIKDNKNKSLWGVCQEYCKNDVLILKEALKRYSNSMSDICNSLCDMALKRHNIDYNQSNIKKYIEKKTKKDFKHNDMLENLCEKFNIKRNEANWILEKYGLSKTNPLASLTKASFAYKLFAKYSLKYDLVSYLPYSVDKFIRESFHGGKTCNISRFQEKSPYSDKKIILDDISSSYPACQLFNSVPTKFIVHKKLLKIDYSIPENKSASKADGVIEYESNKINFNACHMFIRNAYYNGYIGFYRCNIKVPSIIHPVLSTVGSNGRLIDACYNIEGEVFCSNELIKAMDKGYIITKITEYALFERSKCEINKAECDDEKTINQTIQTLKTLDTNEYFFLNYLDNLGEIKTITSDTFAMQKNISKILEYRIYDKRNWVFGDIISILYNKKSEIDKDENPGMYTCIKILLNSIWGKMGERPHIDKTSYYSSKCVTKYMKMLLREKKDKIVVNNEIPIGASVMCKYAVIDKDYSSPKSIAVAAAITSWGRLRLYDAVEHYDAELLYYDTDSAIAYSTKKPPLSTHGYIAGGLGAWEREENDIKEYYSTAPKAYSLKREVPVKDELYKISSKGIPIKKSTKVFVDDKYYELNKELAHEINKKMILNNISNFNYTMIQFKRDKFMKLNVIPDFKKINTLTQQNDVNNKRIYFTIEENERKFSYSLPLGHAY